VYDHVLDPDSQVVLLLCGSFVRGPQDVQPLTPSEYNSLADWLKEMGLRPSVLLSAEGTDRLRQGFTGRADRMISLLQRGAALAMAVEGWTNRGLWIISRAETGYPARLKHRLGKAAPPLLYGAGNRDLLDSGGLAVVGSRNADDIALEFTRYIAEKCAKENIRIVSGGARGIDKEAMLEALKKGGTAAGVLSDSLEKEALSGKYRHAIREGKLALVSPYPPGAGFSAGNAMGRNKLIYALADYAMVISSDVKGGTWAGAIENLKKKYVPLIVRRSPAVPEGNGKLIEQGGTAFEEEWLTKDFRLGDWLKGLNRDARPDADRGLFSSESEPSQAVAGVQETFAYFEPDVKERRGSAAAVDTEDSWPAVRLMLLDHLQCEMTEKALAEKLKAMPTQVRAWLKRAVAEKSVVKRVKPVRYIASICAMQMSLDYE